MKHTYSFLTLLLIFLLIIVSVSAQKNEVREAERHYQAAIDLRNRSNYEHSGQEFVAALNLFARLADRSTSGLLRKEYQKKHYLSHIGICENLLMTEKYERAYALAHAVHLKLELLLDVAGLSYEILKIKSKAEAGKKKFAEALIWCNKALDAAYILSENSAQAQAEAHALKGLILAASGKRDESAQALEKALSLINNQMPSYYRLKIDFLLELSRVKRFPENLIPADMAIELIEKELTSNHFMLPPVKFRKCQILFEAGRKDECSALLIQTIKLFNLTGAVNHPNLSDAYLMQAGLYFEAGKANDAYENIKKAGAIRSYVYGPYHPKYAEARFYSAKYFLIRRDFPKTKSELDAGFRLLEQALTPDTALFFFSYLLYKQYFDGVKKNTEAGFCINRAKNLISGVKNRNELLTEYYLTVFISLLAEEKYAAAEQTLVQSPKNGVFLPEIFRGLTVTANLPPFTVPPAVPVTESLKTLQRLKSSGSY